MRFLGRFLRDGDVVLEIGAGDGAVSRALAPRARHVFALDVSPTILAMGDRPANTELVLSDGVSVPVPPASVTFAYSNQVMEHLHPDDAREQLTGVVRALAPGGRYLCITPHRAAGPHDISSYFADEPQGFHLHEYSVAELARLFRAAGFARVETFAYVRGRAVRVPSTALRIVEVLALRLPPRARRRWTHRQPLRLLVNSIQMVGHTA